MTGSRSSYAEPLSSPSRVQNDFSRRSPSPVQDMNYFEGIQAIREEQNEFYRNLLAQQSDKHEITSQLVQRTRQSVATDIQMKYYQPRAKG